METTNNHRNENQSENNRKSSPANPTAEQTPSQNQARIDAQRGDNDDFTTNGLDEGNMLGNDDDVSAAREAGTR